MQQKNVYTVGQINTYIKNMFTQDYVLRRIYIKGEVSNCKYHSSGHIYFMLKDETGTIACVMFASARKGLGFSMRDGQQVIILGSVNVYERDGRYQVYANEIILDGAGLLYEKYEALKRELEEMGMFAPQYKQPIPTHVRKLGIVTAPTGAAIRDIMNIAYRRNPYIQLILYPALVQGSDAAPSIIKGIKALDAYGVDAMIVGRGGGSIEDLWAFNEEMVARAIFDCSTPVISAVGHETDTTIADYVADLRAPTPSAAAELAVLNVAGLEEQLFHTRTRLYRGMKNQLHDKRSVLEGYRVKINYLSPQNQIREKRQQLADIDERIRSLMTARLEENRTRVKNGDDTLKQQMSLLINDSRHRFSIYLERLKGLSPLDKLNQGYAYVSHENKKKVSSVHQVKQGDQLEVFVRDGSILTRVEKTQTGNLGG